ncbi:Hypothetical predicted protein, partial [Marmota monax]
QSSFGAIDVAEWTQSSAVQWALHPPPLFPIEPSTGTQGPPTSLAQHNQRGHHGSQPKPL